MICRGLVAAESRTFSAPSVGLEHGARFVAAFPATDADASGYVAASLARKAATDAAEAPPTVLLVEDHDDTATALARVLEGAGRSAGCSAEALQLAEAVDVLVSDLGLPDGDGLDLMRTLRTKRPQRGVALTAHSRAQDLAALREAGFEQHLTKPVAIGGLLATTIARLARPAAA